MSKRAIDRVIRHVYNSEAIVAICEGMTNHDSLNHSFHTGELHQEKADCTEAISDLSNLLRLDPRKAAAYYYRGLLFRSLRLFEPAAEDFETAIELEPHNTLYRDYLK